MHAAMCWRDIAGPTKCSSAEARRLSAVNSEIGALKFEPAKSIAPCHAPYRDTASFARVSMSRSRVMSHAAEIPPTLLASSYNGASRRPASTRFAPSREKRLAAAAPALPCCARPTLRERRLSYPRDACSRPVLLGSCARLQFQTRLLEFHWTARQMTGSPTVPTDEQVHVLLAKQAITEQLHRYCRALDRLDEGLLRSVFFVDSTHEQGAFRGRSQDFCSIALDLLASLERSHHQLGNVLIEMRGHAAVSESYFTAYHRLGPCEVLGPLFGAHDPSIAEDVFIGGRYIDKFEFREGAWRIAGRVGLRDWETWVKASDRVLGTLDSRLLGARNASDASYWRFANEGS